MKPKNFYPDNRTEERKEEKKQFAKYIGKQLRKIRESKGISQEQLSNTAGYYHTFVNKIENGKYSPSLHTIWRLSFALGLSLSEFFRDF